MQALNSGRSPNRIGFCQFIPIPKNTIPDNEIDTEAKYLSEFEVSTEINN